MGMVKEGGGVKGKGCMVKEKEGVKILLTDFHTGSNTEDDIDTAIQKMSARMLIGHEETNAKSDDDEDKTVFNLQDVFVRRAVPASLTEEKSFPPLSTANSQSLRQARSPSVSPRSKANGTQSATSSTSEKSTPNNSPKVETSTRRSGSSNMLKTSKGSSKKSKNSDAPQVPVRHYSTSIGASSSSPAVPPLRTVSDGSALSKNRSKRKKKEAEEGKKDKKGIHS